MRSECATRGLGSLALRTNQTENGDLIGRHGTSKMTEPISAKRPEIVYGKRKKDPEAPSLPRDQTRVTEANFKQKLFEVFRPPTEPKLNAEEEAEDEAHELDKRQCVKNAHELLEGGRASRFQEELQYLIEELQTVKAKHGQPSVHLLRSIARKLFGDGMSTMQVSSLRATGLVEKLVRELSHFMHGAVHVRHFLVLLLNALVADVRRVDFFLEMPIAIDLAILLLEEDAPIDGAIYGRMLSTKAPSWEMGLWLLSKCLLSMQTCSDGCAVPRGKDIILLLEAPLKSEATVNVSRAIYCLGAMASDPLFFTDASKLLIECAELDALQVLLSITGAEISLKACNENVISLLVANISPADEDRKCLLLAILINLVDRNSASARFLCPKLPSVPRELDLLSTAYGGVLYGITSVMASSTEPFDPLIPKCFDLLITHLRTHNTLSESIASQLSFFCKSYSARQNVKK